MTKEEISIFTNRISSCNGTGIIAVLFDIYSCYTDDAKCALKKMGEKDALKDYTYSLRQASLVLRHLKGALDFKYDISKDLYSLYDYCERALAKAAYSLDETEIDNTIKVMDQIGASFREIAKNDTSPSVMGHTQKVRAGFTYGKYDVNETVYTEVNRGYFV